MHIVAPACPHGHELKTSDARDRQGYCRKCKAGAERGRRERNRAALALARELADRVAMVDDPTRTQLVEIAVKLQALVA